MSNNFKVIIPAAGKGTRFSPFTSVVPKELLPIMQYPAIEFIVKEYRESGVSKAIFIINKEKESIIDYVNFRFKDHKKLETVYQKEALGLGHAILQAEEFFKNSNTPLFDEIYVGKKPIFKDVETGKIVRQSKFCGIMLPDDIFFSEIPVLQQLETISQKYDASVIAIREVPKNAVSAYGIINIEKEIEDGVFLIKDVIEKPSEEEAPSHYAITGRYILDTDIFAYLKQIQPGAKGEYQLTDAISLLIKSGKPVLAVLFEGKLFDIGTPQGWLKAVNFYAEHQEKI